MLLGQKFLLMYKGELCIQKGSKPLEFGVKQLQQKNSNSVQISLLVSCINNTGITVNALPVCFRCLTK